MAIIMIALIIGIYLFWNIPTLESIPGEKARAYVRKNLSIIIPARNEEENLQVLFRSISSQSDLPYEIIVADDQSEDQTKKVAEAFGAKVIEVPDLPAGWSGKSWACWNGANSSTGTWLLFLDADTIVERNGLDRLADLFRHIENKGILTVHPYHKTKKAYENGSAIFHMMTIGAIGAFVPSWAGKKANGAFGQVLMCRREDYFGWGGHESIKGEIVENMAMGQKIKEYGKSVYFASGKKAISMRMYPDGVKAMTNGWAKSFASGAKTASLVYLILSSIWLAGLLSFFVKIPVLFSEAWLAYVLLYAAAVIQLAAALSRFGRFSIWGLIAFPLHLLYFLSVFGLSLYKTFIRKNASWKGRSIVKHSEGDHDQ
ncbi:glycosyltransferase [Bacillus sp. FJAT-42376]|uniref:glycosyltransferase n=1 Tax=Bacillus sp. FJAT-42376 TaxID=2014076 RepID=UPI000F50DE6D|nr:glycosyltransferase family 2 protein [Bacillus sp. FJAT-42376]AZB42573.1 glycosyltransferase [Bacillus sp. FJAT-42376]